MDFSTNRRTPLFLAIVLGLSLTAVGCGEKKSTEQKTSETKTTGEQQGKVLATVNGDPITEGDLNDYRSGQPNSAQAQNQGALLDRLVAQKVIYQDALRQKLDKDPEVLKTLNQLRTRILVAATVREALEKNPIPDKELHAKYDELKKRMVHPEYKARHILVKSEAEAKKLIKQLDAGADFDKLAREHSTGPTGKKGGDLGWINAEQLVPSFSEALKKLEKGKYTKEPVKTRFGWHVIKLEDSRQSKAPAFEDIKERQTQLLQQEQVGKYIQALKDKADISIKGEADASGGKKAESTKEKTDASNAK